MCFQLRSHQVSAVEIVKDLLAARKRQSILAWVVPGGGKSALPPLMLQELPREFKIGWFAPRISLRDQAEQDCPKNFGITINGSGNDVDPSKKTRGFVATHDALAQDPELWMQELKRSPYLLVIDEVHHAKVDKNGIQNPLAKAIDKLPYHMRLLMTGTLDTNDGKFIYGVNYKKGDRGSVPDFDSHEYKIRYDRTTALTERALVPVRFHHFDGPVRWNHIQTDIDDGCTLSEADKKQESNAIFTALSTGLGESLLNATLDDFRTRGGKLLVVVHSQEAAKHYHKRIGGNNTFLAITDNENARNDIRLFKERPGSILVTCQMAYEGLDAPEITHIACLTNIRSVPWIEQMIGRAWRYHQGKRECFVFVPDDPRMNRVIARIHKEQPAEIFDAIGSGGGTGDPQRADIIPKDGKAERISVRGLDGADTVTESQAELIAAFKKCGISTDDPRVLSLLEDMNKPPESGGASMLHSEELTYLRNKISEICRQADSKLGPPPKFGVHQKKLIRLTGKSITQMSKDELRRAYDRATQFIA